MTTEQSLTRITCVVEGAANLCEIVAWFTQNRYTLLLLPAEEGETKVTVVGYPPR